MTCDNCGAEETIKAHLIPRVFCKQVQTGMSHAAQVNASGNFLISQSGVWDSTILCSTCDGVLGEYERYAHKVSSGVRDRGSDASGRIKIMSNVDTVKMLRFCAGILYKYSLTSERSGKITLGRYKNIIREFIFDQAKPAPNELDVFIFRPLRHYGDKGVFAYRAPLPDRKYGINMYRMMMGGLIFFVKLDRRRISDPNITPFLIKGREELSYLTVPATLFEEFKLARDALRINPRLSDYLDQQPSP
jgi:hypothetical protein